MKLDRTFVERPFRGDSFKVQTPIRKFIISVLTSLIFISIACPTYIDLTYSDRMPSSPQPEAGRTYRIVVNHGFVVYVTRDEFDRATFIHNKRNYFDASFGLLLIALYFENAKELFRGGRGTNQTGLFR